ncbi:MAG: hypothetical protein K2X27_12605 [Candidatus Obscuribacterales bacterium]|nr:hypothetical protein [Candidatus Obscuribacterales bacterium]
MGKQKNKISNSERWAIWTGHGMKCFWCKQGLDFSEFEIDRLIPKSTSRIVLKSLVKDYDLATDFSADCIGNLIPSCRPCAKRRANSSYRGDPAFTNLFKVMRERLPNIESKVHRIEADPALESKLRLLLEKLEQGEVSREDAELLAAPFLRAVEGSERGNLEFRFSPLIRIFLCPDGVRLQAPSEIRYEKLMERVVESADWKRKVVEEMREGPSFGEASSRKPGSGA